MQEEEVHLGKHFLSLEEQRTPYVTGKKSSLRNRNVIYLKDDLKFIRKLFSVTRKIIPVTVNLFPVTGNLFRVTGNLFPVMEDLFPVTGHLFLVTRNLSPVTGIKKNTSCHRTFFL